MSVNVNLMEQNVNQINGGIMISVDVSVKKSLTPATCNCENGKNLPSIMDDSLIICDEIINVKKQILMKNL